MAYDNNNSGMLARNERKVQPNHPDFTGQCEIGGVQYWISGWVKDGKQGSKMEGKRYFSLAFKPKDAPAGGSVAASSGQPTSAPARPSRTASSTTTTTSSPQQDNKLEDDGPF